MSIVYDIPRWTLDLDVGDIVIWNESGHASGSPLRITRRSPDGISWLAVRLKPEPWEKAGQEWLIHYGQVEAGRYARLSDAHTQPSAEDGVLHNGAEGALRLERTE